MFEALRDKVTFPPKRFVLEFAAGLCARVPGHIMEFGVAEGTSTRILRRVARADKRVYGCDSFEGLREKFENAGVGTFACEQPKIAGVEIVKG